MAKLPSGRTQAEVPQALSEARTGPLEPVIQEQQHTDQVTKHGQYDDHFNATEIQFHKSADPAEHRVWIFSR